MKSVLRKHDFPGTAVLCTVVITLTLLLGGCPQPSGDSSPAVQYTITFDSQGGSSVAAIKANEGTAVPEPAVAPTRDGYTFQGWYSAANGGTKYTWPHTLNADVTMYAQWQIVLDGTEQAAVDAFKNNTDVKAALEKNPAEINLETTDLTDIETKVNAALAAYNNLSDKAKEALTAEHGRLTALKAKIEELKNTAHSYTITYELNGGTNAGANPATYTAADLPLTLAAPTRTGGYTFGGWYYDSGFSGTAVTQIPAGSTGNKTFYAQWLAPGSAQITLTIATLTDKAAAAFDDTGFTLSKSGGTKTITVEAGVTDVSWYIGLAKIGTENAVTLDPANLAPGAHFLRVTAKYAGVLYSKELRFTVTN
jgi:uncharacterized repeat protein (TIGR02543 family)